MSVACVPTATSSEAPFSSASSSAMSSLVAAAGKVTASTPRRWTRVKLGGKLVDAKGVSRLYRQSLSGSSLVLLVCSAIAAMTAAVAVTTLGRAYLGVLAEWWDNLMFTLFS